MALCKNPNCPATKLVQIQQRQIQVLQDQVAALRKDLMSLKDAEAKRLSEVSFRSLPWDWSKPQ